MTRCWHETDRHRCLGRSDPPRGTFRADPAANCGTEPAPSVLFPGDAEALEEADLAIDAPVTLLQVGHHGSKTSSRPTLLDRAQPKYAVISTGKPGEGTNATYCHPRKETVDALTAVLGGAGGRTIHAFPLVTKCDASGAQWIDDPASDRLWVTARDGDVVVTATGDGVFTRE